MTELILLLKFMTGCWEMNSGATTIEESWSAPRAGLMLGYGRTIRGGKLRFHEFMRIEEREGKLVFMARIGENPTPFTAVKVTADEVVFENLEHDDPKRIIYRRNADGLAARTEGKKALDFPYRRIACVPD